MKKQRTTVNAKNQAEFDSRIADLIERGYQVGEILEPQENEYRHYKYGSDSRTVWKKHAETDVQKKLTATLFRWVES